MHFFSPLRHMQKRLLVTFWPLELLTGCNIVTLKCDVRVGTEGHTDVNVEIHTLYSLL